jgi:hypothetical protein
MSEMQTRQTETTETFEASATDADADAEEPTDTNPLPKDDLFHLLQNERRRNVLRYLRGRDEPVRMRDVAEQVAAWEHDTTVEQLSSDERQRVYISLYQSHLDTLDEADVIDYNQPRGVVTPTPLVDDIARYAEFGLEEETESDRETTWERRYLAVSGISVLLLLGGSLDIAGLAALSSFASSILILAMFVGLTLAKLGDDKDETED